MVEAVFLSCGHRLDQPVPAGESFDFGLFLLPFGLPGLRFSTWTGSVGFGLFLAFLLLVGQFPWTVGIFFFLVLAIQTLFSVTLGIGLGVLNVFFRDVGQMLGVALQFWFWFTPVVYPAVIVPESLRGFFVINPMYHIVSAYQSIFVYHRCPELEGLGAVLVLGLVIGVWALRIYRKHVGEMVDEL